MKASAGAKAKGNCRICGAELEHGKRVRVSFGWESIGEYICEDGSVKKYIDTHSTSGVVCKACAYSMLEKMGLERP